MGGESADRPTSPARCRPRWSGLRKTGAIAALPGGAAISPIHRDVLMLL
jgi:hypothetical protein